MYIQDYTYEKYLGYLVKEGTIDKAGDKFVFRCFICGDSQTDINKKRGALIYNEEGATICCFNCGARENFIKYLLEHHRDMFVELVRDNNGDRSYKSRRKIRNTSINNKEEFKSIYDCSDNAVRHECMNIVQNRRIPYRTAQGLKYATEGKFANRLIIPYYRKDGTYEYLSARDITGKDPEKYKTPYNMDRPIYNIDFVDDSVMKYAFEGELDSSFIENSAAFGSNTILEKFLSSDNEISRKFSTSNTIVIPDNDVPGLKTSINLMKRGYRIMRWATRAYKDFNDAVIGGFFIINERGLVSPDSIYQYVMEPNAFNMFALESLLKNISGDNRYDSMGGR